MLRNLLLALLIFESSAALACSCARYADSDFDDLVQRAYNSASSVLLATAKTIEPAKTIMKFSDEEYEAESEITHFVTEQSWKGKHDKQFSTKIVTECCACGFSFEEGKQYLLYLYGPKEDGFYGTSICSRTKSSEHEDAQKEVKLLDTITSENSEQATQK